ncbi:MAG TPA: class A beta-lactamase [Mycobacterium sp.]|nr:class A beta-lactamase [Mycobacterium sp.]
MGELARRRAFVVGALTLGAAWGSRWVASAAPSVEDRITALEQRYAARVGLFASDLVSGRTMEHHADDMLAMCSTFKTYAAGRVLRGCDRGELHLSDQVFVNPAAVQPNSPVTEPQAGHDMTLGDLCAAALQHSDNTAANLLLATIGGPSEVTAFARSIGDHVTRLDRCEVALNSALPGDPRDTTTPRAFARGYQALLTGPVLSEPSRRQLDDWMRGNVTSTMRAGLPPGWTSADKTGSGDYGSTNDVGIAYGPDGRKLLLAIMTRSAVDDPHAENPRALIGDLAALVVTTLR